MMLLHQLTQLQMQSKKYLHSVQLLVLFRTDLSIQSTTSTTLLRILHQLSLVSVIQTWLKRWLTTARTTFLFRLDSLCLHRLISLTRVFSHSYSNHLQLHVVQYKKSSQGQCHLNLMTLLARALFYCLITLQSPNHSISLFRFHKAPILHRQYDHKNYIQCEKELEYARKNRQHLSLYSLAACPYNIGN